MRTLLATFLITVASPIALADPTPDVHKLTADDCARARKLGKTCVLSIDAEAVEGGVTRPTDEQIVTLPTGDHASLIRIRRDFIPEILKSAEDL